MWCVSTELNKHIQRRSYLFRNLSEKTSRKYQLVEKSIFYFQVLNFSFYSNYLRGSFFVLLVNLIIYLFLHGVETFAKSPNEAFISLANALEYLKMIFSDLVNFLYMTHYGCQFKGKIKLKSKNL